MIGLGTRHAGETTHPPFSKWFCAPMRYAVPSLSSMDPLPQRSCDAILHLLALCPRTRHSLTQTAHTSLSSRDTIKHYACSTQSRLATLMACDCWPWFMTPVLHHLQLVAAMCVDEDETVSKVERINSKLVLQSPDAPHSHDTSFRTIRIHIVAANVTPLNRLFVSH
jgi:hypothetical protein